jgi:hypothetical protein
MNMANVNKGAWEAREKQAEERMVTQRIPTVVLAAVLTVGGPVLGLAQSSQTNGDRDQAGL